MPAISLHRKQYKNMNKDIFLSPKIQNKQQDIILTLKFYYNLTNLRNDHSGNKLLRSKIYNKIKNQKMLEVVTVTTL